MDDLNKTTMCWTKCILFQKQTNFQNLHVNNLILDTETETSLFYAQVHRKDHIRWSHLPKLIEWILSFFQKNQKVFIHIPEFLSFTKLNHNKIVKF